MPDVDYSIPLRLTARKVYGKIRVYPTNKMGELLVSLTEGKTFHPKHLETLKALGFKIEITPEV